MRSSTWSKLKLPSAHIVAKLAAVLLMIFALTQLFAFEDMVPAIKALFAISDSSAHLISAALVTAEVFALPFLFRIELSSILRVTSMLLGWVAIAMLLVVASKEVAVYQPESILLGTKLPLAVGIWNVLIVLALGTLVAWSAVDVWPFRKK